MLWLITMILGHYKLIKIRWQPIYFDCEELACRIQYLQNQACNIFPPVMMNGCILNKTLAWNVYRNASSHQTSSGSVAPESTWLLLLCSIYTSVRSDQKWNIAVTPELELLNPHFSAQAKFRGVFPRPVGNELFSILQTHSHRMLTDVQTNYNPQFQPSRPSYSFSKKEVPQRLILTQNCCIMEWTPERIFP